MAIHIPGLIAIILFYLLILGVGLWAARKTGFRKKRVNTDDVMLAGRNIGLFIGCFTMTATWVGGGFINGSSEIIVSSGLTWCQAPVGYGLALAFGGVFFADKLRRCRYGTMLDPFNRKYGDVMGAILYIPAMLGEMFWSAAILSALGATLAVILGIDTTLSIIISAAISLLYTLVGGLYSVAYTDVLQLICIFIGLWLSVPFALTNEAVGSIITNSSTTWVKEVAPTDIGIYMDTWLLLIFGGIPWQVYFQRVLSAQNESIARSLSFFAAFGCMFMAVPAVLIGAIASNTDWNMTTYDKQVNGTIPGDQLSLTLPLVLRYLTPDAVSFVGLGAVSAAVMSSTDSSLLSSSSMFARNVFGVIYRAASGKLPSDTMTVWVMRGTQLVLAACACAMAISVSSIYYLFYLCSDLVFVILFPQLTCAIYLPGTNTYGSLAGFILGLTFRLLSGEPGLGLPPTILFPWYTKAGGQGFPFRTLSMLITLFTIIFVSYPVRYLFRKGILPKRADVFGCFSGQPMSNMHLSSGPMADISAEVNVNPDLPPGYQPYVRENWDIQKKNKEMSGQYNRGFQSDAGKTGYPEKNGLNETEVHHRPITYDTHL